MKIGILLVGRAPEDLVKEYGTYAEMLITLINSEEKVFEFKTFNILDDSLEDQIKYFFFQGNLLKHRGFIEQSFNVFNKANKLKLEVSKDEIIVAANKNSDSLMRIDKWMPNPPELVGKRLAKLFIMGPSKSGKSSVEHILSESSQVKTLYEIIKHKELIKVYGCGKYSSETIFKNIVVSNLPINTCP